MAKYHLGAVQTISERNSQSPRSWELFRIENQLRSIRSCLLLWAKLAWHDWLSEQPFIKPECFLIVYMSAIFWFTIKECCCPVTEWTSIRPSWSPFSVSLHVIYWLPIDSIQDTQTLPKRFCYTYRRNGAKACSENNTPIGANSVDRDAFIANRRIRYPVRHHHQLGYCLFVESSINNKV